MNRLSNAQHGMWTAARTGAATAYHMPVVITLGAPPDRDALAAACRAVVTRHPQLAAAVRERDGVPVLEPAAEPPVLESADSIEEVVTRPFDLGAGPLVRFALVGGRTLVVVAHHLVFDGHSKDLLVAELSAAMAATTATADAPPVTAASPVAAASLADGGDRPGRDAPADSETARQRNIDSATEEAARFWAPRWHEPPATRVPGGELRSRAAAPGAALEFPLEIPGLDGVTRFEVLVAALHTVLASYGNAEVVTALDLSTRTAAEAGLIGCHVNELPLFSRPSPDEPFSGFAARLRTELRELYRHREVPLARAVRGIRPHAALAPVSISYRRLPDVASPLGDVQWLAFNHSVRGALQLQIAHGPHGALASLRHDPRELPDPAHFADDLVGLLAAVGKEPGRPLGGLVRFAPAPVAPDGPPDPAPLTAASAADVPAADEALVAQIRTIWEQVLDLAPIEPHDDIFDLGGHSLTITQIIARMQQQLGLEIGLDDFFDNPTIAGVVAVVRR
ncbi:condensation domain-containing protein [Streptacidiphilus griseoplanus]|uniref:condensation domain-containing protein n=1 Tax=Peterkaempfera griseoplana TaxID=66896 RepID=UPI000A56F395|nr:condensation domain-containing protein [Peterkaempfera griseoplana]